MRGIQSVGRLAIRALSTSARCSASAATAEPLGPSPKGVVPASRGYERVRKMQKVAFEKHDNDVYVLFGTRDHMLFVFTLFMLTLSAGLVGRGIYGLMFPKKKE